MSIKEKYGLTDEGVRNVKLGAAWTAVSNLVTFGGVGVFYLLMQASSRTSPRGRRCRGQRRTPRGSWFFSPRSL